LGIRAKIENKKKKNMLSKIISWLSTYRYMFIKISYKEVLLVLKCMLLILCMIILILSGELNYKEASNIKTSVKHEDITNRENSFAACTKNEDIKNKNKNKKKKDINQNLNEKTLRFPCTKIDKSTNTSIYSTIDKYTQTDNLSIDTYRGDSIVSSC
jgi:hypothetical protein